MKEERGKEGKVRGTAGSPLHNGSPDSLLLRPQVEQSTQVHPISPPSWFTFKGPPYCDLSGLRVPATPQEMVQRRKCKMHK